MVQNNQPEIVTIRQAAMRKVLPERTLRRLVEENKIPTIKAGRTNYINFTALVEQLNKGEGAIWA